MTDHLLTQDSQLGLLELNAFHLRNPCNCMSEHMSTCLAGDLGLGANLQVACFQPHWSQSMTTETTLHCCQRCSKSLCQMLSNAVQCGHQFLSLFPYFSCLKFSFSPNQAEGQTRTWLSSAAYKSCSQMWIGAKTQMSWNNSDFFPGLYSTAPSLATIFLHIALQI